MGGDGLRVLDRAAVLQIRGDAGGAEGVATGGRGESGAYGAALAVRLVGKWAGG